ncbi:MAG: heavy metal-associated domain-containing protein [Peptostreptococcaceae bacterium]|nr:heavy metal-associated domain-containing protein [Peptostreptococcaceae bacterium]
MQKTISIFGMSCHKCVAHVQHALEALSQVESAKVSLQDQNAVVRLKEDVSDEILKETIEDIGYDVKGIS